MHRSAHINEMFMLCLLQNWLPVVKLHADRSTYQVSFDMQC